jgi:alpha amylase-like protein
VDLVPNHTSDQHPWFKESRSSRINPKREWYIWRDGKGPGQPPNNWLAWFGGSAWKLDPQTKQYYISAEPRRISLDLKPYGIAQLSARPLLTSSGRNRAAVPLSGITLAPFGVFIGAVP